MLRCAAVCDVNIWHSVAARSVVAVNISRWGVGGAAAAAATAAAVVVVMVVVTSAETRAILVGVVTWGHFWG